MPSQFPLSPFLLRFLKQLRSFMKATAVSFIFLAIILPMARGESNSNSFPLTIGTIKPLSQFNPLNQFPGKIDYLRALVLPPIVFVQTNWQWDCYLCVSMPTQENGGIKLISHTHDDKKETSAVERFMNKGTADKLETNWTIDENVFWGDGEPVTGYDIAETMQLLAHSLSQSEHPPYFPVEKVVVNPKKPREFAVIFKEPRSDYFMFLAISAVPSHKLTDDEIKSPAQAWTKLQHLYSETNTDPGLYYGPFVPKTVESQNAYLVSNPHAKRSTPYDTLKIKGFTSSASLLAAVGQGVDIAAEDSYNIRDLEQIGFVKNPPGGFSLQSVTGPAQEHLVLNLRNPILADNAVRQAISYALDREAIAGEIFGDKKLVTDQFYHPSDPFHTKPTTHYVYNPDFSKRLLSDAGWIDRGVGVREKNGEVLKFQLKYIAELNRPRIGEMIVGQLKKIGIEITLIPEEPSVFFDNTLPQANFRDFVLLSWTTAPRFAPWNALHSKEIPAMETNFKGDNIGAFFSKEFDSALEDLSKELTVAKQRALADRITSIYLDQLPTIPLFFRPKVFLVPKKIKDFLPPSHIYPSILYMNQWKPLSH